MFARAEGERGNGGGRLAPRGGHHAAAVADEQIRHVVRPVVAVDDRRAWIVAHSARPEQVYPLRLRANRLGPHLQRPGRPRDLHRV